MRIFTGFKKILREILYPLTAGLLLASIGCNMQVKYLPQIAAPYISEVEFLKEVIHEDSEIRKIPFEGGAIGRPFYMVVKLENVENRGRLRIRFYRRNLLPASAVMNGFARYIHSGLLSGITWPGGPAFPEVRIRNRAGSGVPGADIVNGFYRGSFFAVIRVVSSPGIFDPGCFSLDRFELTVPDLMFDFGEEGKYYEYILFVDKIKNLSPGSYRYGIFLNEDLMLAESFKVTAPGQGN